ncbi:class A beta-lactamase-related serine hydrolase [Chitinophaga lutea]|uniref:Class A beta-lactamase-related serine hydrolase n=1 Tax=Chitinophaga lutea TaxID=2488634 RepID=A0A3N4PGV8_9BACT|nr:serine hydrolase domain-containing protein [Chitinophaga lutea]RPE07933.1 class A beta-lactamase-related serine hydrolase [Chitinophaga lutea]
MKTLHIAALLSAITLHSTAQTNQKGFDPARLQRIDRFIEKEIEEHRIPGASVLLIKKGQVVYNKAFGYADIESKRRMKTDDIFRVASQTKAVTSVAAMLLWEEGKFLLDDPISKYIPAFRAPKVLTGFNPKDSSYTTRPAKREITVRHLLTHTSGLIYQLPYMGDPGLAAIYNKAGIPSLLGAPGATVGDKMQDLAKLPLLHDPGETFTYGLSSDLLGYLVEIWSGQNLETFFRERILGPLEMNDTYFNLPADKAARLISVYQPLENGRLVKAERVFDRGPGNYPAIAHTYLSGGGGLSSTTADYAKFLQMVLHKGNYKGKQLLSPHTVAMMLTNQLNDNVGTSPYPAMPENFQFGLGFALETDRNDHLQPLRKGSFSWEGAVATYYWVDPQEDLIALFYTQEFGTPKWNEYQQMFRVLTYQAMAD